MWSLVCNIKLIAAHLIHFICTFKAQTEAGYLGVGVTSRVLGFVTELMEANGCLYSAVVVSSFSLKLSQAIFDNFLTSLASPWMSALRRSPFFSILWHLLFKLSPSEL